MTTESNEDIGIKYAELLKNMLIQKGNYGDYYWLELRINKGKSSISNLIAEVNILYSRYSSGGSYQSICLVSMTTDEIIIYKYPQYDANEERIEEFHFRLDEPNCFDTVVEFIVKIAKKMQKDRNTYPYSEKPKPPVAWYKAVCATPR